MAFRKVSRVATSRQGIPPHLFPPAKSNGVYRACRIASDTVEPSAVKLRQRALRSFIGSKAHHGYIVAHPGDTAIGLCTSGGSVNKLREVEAARRLGMLPVGLPTVGLAGYDGGGMTPVDTIDHLIVVPSQTVHRIEQAQTTTHQLLWESTQQALG